MPSQTAGLNIELTAEVAKAVANLRNVNEEFERMGDEAKKALAEASGAIDDLTKGTVSINRLSKALDVFRVAAQNATDPDQLRAYNRSIEQLEEELRRLNNEGRNLNRTLPGTQLGATEAASALTDMGRVASDLPFGFIAIQNNLDPLVNSFSRTFAAAGNLRGGFQALGAAMLGPAGIGFAFSAISSLITVSIQKYGSLDNAIKEVFGTLTLAERMQKAYNDAVTTGSENAQENIVMLDAMYKAATNLNVPLKDRNLIADELQKKYPSIFGNLKNEAILAGQAADAYARVREQLIGVATAEAFKDVQVEQAKKLIKLQQEETKSREKLLEASIGLRDANKELEDSRPQQGFQKGAAAVAAYSLQVRLATMDLEKNAKAQGDIIAIQEDLAKKQQELIAQFGATALGIEPDKAKSSKKQVQTVADVVKDLNNDIINLNANFLATGGNLRDLTEDKLKAFGNAISELSKMGIGQSNGVFAGLLRDITSLRNVLSTNKPVVKIPIVIEPLPAVNNSQTVAILNKNLEGFEAPLNNFTKRINAMIQGVLVDGVSSVFEGIGEGLATGNFSNVLKGFANVLSGYLSQLGKTLIANGLAIEAFKKSLQSLQGIPAILAGGALIAASAAFKALAGKGVNSFATGGFALGPQLAVIGDNPGQKELIVPSEDFDKLGGGGNFTVTHRVSGRELLLVIQRESKELNRFN